MAKKIEMVGRTYGRLTVLSEGGPPSGGFVKWMCRCACGSAVEVIGNNLRRGTTVSCGCYGTEKRRIAATKLGAAAHGKVTPELRAWLSMKQRCLNPNHRYWDSYGGRGITVASQWVGDFSAFLADVGPRPSPRHSLDRIDNDGNYEPSNVRWALPSTQLNNRRTTCFVALNSGAEPLQIVAQRTGIEATTIWRRIKKGMSPDLAASLPSRARP